MKKITVWELDTCDCVIEIHWESDVAPEGRTYEYRQRVACPHHIGPDGTERAKADNHFKCAVVGAAGEDATWHFTADRRLFIDLDRKNEAAARAEAIKHAREVIFAVR